MTMTTKVMPTWTGSVNGVPVSVQAWTKGEARAQLKERFALDTLPRTTKLKKAD